MQKAFCIKTGRAKQLQEEMWAQDGTGCSSLEGNFTQAAPNSQRSAKEGARQEKPSLTPARAQRDPKSTSCLCTKPVGEQRGGWGAGAAGWAGWVCRRGWCQAREPRRELGMHRAAPPGALQPLLTPSERGSSPLLWPEEYRLTYSPSPASSLAFSL